ncbi:hypothetical protein SLS62_001834 [Diatrype stigma]|uniref:Uncharacterized protein n=1 Tax=Diatrype stigma TaxID=117547 RepID=A0AAN9UVI3_9PEZI
MQYSPGEKALPVGPVPDRLQLDQFLLESKPDADIAAELRSLGQLIQQHVENQYHIQPVQTSPSALAPALVDLGLMDERDPSAAVSLASLAIDTRTRWAALQHIISRVTFASISLDGHSPVSLLPPFAGAFVRSLPPIESHRGSSEAVNVALTRWRQLTAFLLHPSRSERTPLMPSEDVSTQQAQELAAALSRFLQTFVSGGRESRYEQENHLREVIVECAALGYVIFSQPSEYRFRYDGKDGSSNGIVTCPGLDKISDEEGRRYAMPYTLVTPVIEGTYVSHSGI